VNDLLARAVAAHGGLERWNEFSRMTVPIVSGGGLWPMKGLSQDSNPHEQTVTLHEETASVSPFGQPDWPAGLAYRLQPRPDCDRTSAGALISERSRPRDFFCTPHYEYAVGSASPCVFQGLCSVDLPDDAILDGHAWFRSRRITPWQDAGGLWPPPRGFRTRLPPVAQDFYFGEDFLLPRHDYCVDAVYDIVEFEELRFPTKCRSARAAERSMPVMRACACGERRIAK
jgi:hypothetical protein